NRSAAIDDDRRARNETSRGGRKQKCGSRDVLGLADHVQWTACKCARQSFWIVPKRFCKVRLYEARRNAIDANPLLSPFQRKIARKLEVGGFRYRVGAKHAR